MEGHKFWSIICMKDFLILFDLSVNYELWLMSMSYVHLSHRSHTPTSPSLPSLLPTTAPPPCPPKKAELAGNPLNPSIPDDQLQSVDTSKQVLDGIDQEFQQRRTKDSGDLINSTLPQRDLGLTTPTSSSFSNQC